MADNNDLNFDIKIEDDKSNQKPKAEVKKDTSDERTKAKEDSNQTYKETIDITNFLSHAHHPIVVVFTLLFKVSSIVV